MTKYNKWLIVLFYAFFAISITAPLASSHYAPASDFLYHAKGILLAKDAIAEHQFPIRIAPNIIDAPRYPLFQFYSPFPYMLAGFFQQFIHNTFIPYKLITWLAMILGGLYIYRICSLLVKNKKIALISGLAYQFSPYWLINTNVRTDFTESVAQGLLPIALYYSMRVFYRSEIKSLFLAAAMWSILLMSHLITFAYSLGFFLIFALLWALKEKNAAGFIRITFAVCLSLMLSAWYLAPILSTHQLLTINGFSNPMWSSIFTPFANLISLQLTSPLPLPAAGELGTEYLYPAIGYPVLLSIGILIFAYFKDKEFYRNNKIVMPLMIVFFLAFLATWSPVDIWQYLPTFLLIFEFTYRLLTQVMWPGILLFAFAMHWLFKNKMDNITAIIIICIVAITGNFWIHTQKNDGTSISRILHSYQTYDALAYQVVSGKLLQKDLLPNSKLMTTCAQDHENMLCEVNNTKKASNITLPMLWYPNLIDIKIDHIDSKYYPTIHNNKVLVGLTLTPGKHIIKASFTGLKWANWISFSAWCLFIIICARSLVYKKRLHTIENFKINPNTVTQS